MDYKNELKNFLDNDEKLKSFPSKNRLKIISLFYLSLKFEQNKQYTEKEVNSILNNWHTFEDWALLRRELYDRRFFNRESDGSFYWLREKQPVLSDFGLE